MHQKNDLNFATLYSIFANVQNIFSEDGYTMSTTSNSQPLFYGPWSMRKNFETEYIPSYMNKISRKSKYEQQQKVY